MSFLPEQIDSLLRLCAVYGMMLLLFLLNTVTLSLPFSDSFEVPLMTMVIYYWAIYRPTLIPAWFVFLMGIAFDLLSGLPVGLSAFVFVGLRWLVSDQRLFLMGQSFVTVWLGYALANLIVTSVQWVLYGFLNLHWSPLEPVGMMIVSGIFFFPAVSIFLHFSHRMLPMLSDQYSVAMK
jgi:rod shape-determining protein MreD